jgi:hypothetical protein
MVLSEDGGSPPGKNQKTFDFSAAPTYPAMAWMSALAQTQKSFGSFLQKRTFFNIPCLSVYVLLKRYTR